MWFRNVKKTALKAQNSESKPIWLSLHTQYSAIRIYLANVQKRYHEVEEIDAYEALKSGDVLQDEFEAGKMMLSDHMGDACHWMGTKQIFDFLFALHDGVHSDTRIY
jgi:hypothetical protein